MSGEPPPYSEPINEKTGPYPPETTPAQQTGYLPQQPGFSPQQPQGYPPPQLQGYPPPQQGYGQPVYAQPQTQVTTSVTSFGRHPIRIQCVNCKTEQVTIVKRRIGRMNWIACGITALVIFIISTILCFAILLGILGLFLLPFAFIALCIPSFKDVDHVCPNCGFTNGTCHGS